jgi:hypothetical protein
MLGQMCMQLTPSLYCVVVQENAAHFSLVLLPAVGLVLLRAAKVLTTIKVCWLVCVSAGSCCVTQCVGVCSWGGGGSSGGGCLGLGAGYTVDLYTKPLCGCLVGLRVSKGRVQGLKGLYPETPAVRAHGTDGGGGGSALLLVVLQAAKLLTTILLHNVDGYSSVGCSQSSLTSPWTRRCGPSCQCLLS